MTITDETGVSDQIYRDRATALANMLTLRPERHVQSTFGSVEPENECGTVACVAGWAALAQSGRVMIASDGVMTWAELRSVVELSGSGMNFVPTLYDPNITAWAQVAGRVWLGLTEESADALFFTMRNAVAVEILRRLGDGRLSRDFTYADRDNVRTEVLGDLGDEDEDEE